MVTLSTLQYRVLGLANFWGRSATDIHDLLHDGKSQGLGDLRAVHLHIATGSNLGNRIEHLDRADRALASLGQVLRVSPTYQTAAVGMAPGTPDFLNRVVELNPDQRWLQAPSALMQALLDIEQDLGRQRRGDRVLSRPIDLDIVLWGDRCIALPNLIVPHPRMLSRRFVLQPLADLIPDQVVPGTGKTASALLRALPEDVPEIAPWPNPTASPTATS